MERIIPSYKMSGPSDSEKEGWFDKSANTGRIEVESPNGTLIAEVCADMEYPGIYLSFRPASEESDGCERLVALLDQEDVPPETCRLLVCADDDKEDYTTEFICSLRK